MNANEAVGQIRGTPNVVTTLGNVPQSDLKIVVRQEQETDTVWVWARECVYVGTRHPDSANKVVRRDVWVTMKSGQVASAEANT